ncbi:hypothetical protein CIG1485E_a0036 (plasmid) [Campylobacter iguaniorum]|uniref:Uncharacterized protein n=1 Tax=Campylobacter iguaniorum TaxID=1244531 RepID=A0A076FC94_9BACT|nr:hypothetical protein [Campylobacter iguaniorum]AII15561.1 hypothetical protein CIG1485E_a0036 [Campylobacter iguaniorum]
MKNVVNETMETSSQLFELVDFGAALKPLERTHPQSFPCGGYGYMQIDYLESDYDGVFPTKASWAKYAKSVDEDGASYILSKMLGGSKKLKGDIGYCQCEREAWYEDTCTMTFKEPIKMVVGGYRSGEGKWIDIIEEVDYLKGEITYEWLWSRGDERASAIEIYLHIKDYGKLDGGVKCA